MSEQDARSLRPWLGSCLGALVLANLLVPVRGLWAAQVLLVPLLLILPGVILLRTLRVPGRAIASFPAYIPAASLAVLMFSGLLVDILPPLAAPLRPLPLLTGFDVVCLGLLAGSVKAPPDTVVPWQSLARPLRLAWPLLLPLVAAAGALRLNSSHGSGVALLALIACVALLIWAVTMAPQLDKTLLAVTIYSAALTLNWGFSLRSDLVNGFDIATEYQRMQTTVASGIWYTSHPADAYGAMLSLTVLPAELHALTGMSGLLVFKVVYPALYAMFPVSIYSLARRILARRWAVVAAIFPMGQYYFTELAALARQEIAFVCFAGLLGAMLDTRIPRRARWSLTAILGATVALSHYSTAYLAITLIGIMIPLQWLASRIRDIPRVSSTAVISFAVTFVIAALWYGPVTHSASHLGQFLQSVAADGLNVLPSSTHGQNLIAAYLHGNTKVPVPARQYAQLIHDYYQTNNRFVHPLPGASNPIYALHDKAAPTPHVRSQLGLTTLSTGVLIITQLSNLLALAGALSMILRKKATIIAREVGLLGVAATFFLTIMRFSGTLAQSYGQERALLQAMLVLAISLCWVMQSASGRLSRRKKRGREHPLLIATATLAMTVCFLSTTGLSNVVMGGGTADNLANSGTSYEFFYETAPEVAAARWLGDHYQAGQLVYADEYAQLRLAAMTPISHGLMTDVTPLTISQHAWIYGSRTNIVDGQAYALYQLHLQASYDFPERFLGDNYNTVYTNGSSEVFHR